MRSKIAKSVVARWFLILGPALWGTAAAGEIRGWRHDGTGSFPDADPPLTWSDTQNVRWKAPLPGWSNASPVLVGDRFFLCQEPDRLLCVSAADGAVLWSRSVGAIDLLAPEERETAAARQREAARLDGERRNVNGQLRRLARQLRDRQDDPDLQQQVAALRARQQEIDRQLEPLRELRNPATHETNGFTSPTPVSDGRRVYVLFGTGIAAGFDLDGHRLWARRIERPNHQWGHSASPALAGGHLVVHIQQVWGLDPETGETRWEVDSRARFGGPVAFRAGGHDLVVTANGEAIRAADGHVIARNLGHVEFNAPIWHDGVVYFIENGGRAVRFPEDGGPPERLWTTTPHRDRYYASPVYLDGILYAITRAGRLSAIDAADGAVIWTQDVRLGGTAYPSIVRAGRHLFVSSDSGRTLVLEPGREFQPIGTNQIESFRTSPLFIGNHIYIRSPRHLYCIAAEHGVTGDAAP